MLDELYGSLSGLLSLLDTPQAIPLFVGVALGLGIVVGWLVTKHRSDQRHARLEQDYNQVLNDSFLDRRVVESTSDGLIVATMTGTIVWVNPAYCAMMQRTADRLIGQHPLSFALPPEDTPSQEEIAKFRFNPSDSSEVGLVLRRNIRANGELFWNQINVSIRTSPDGTQHAIMSCRDVTEQVDREQELEATRARLEYTATHDDLTGLANRSRLFDFTKAALDATGPAHLRVGMLKIDLDRFKELNDTYGHPAGDKALVHIAQMLQLAVRQTDLVARMGGDEFVVICPNVATLDDLETIARALGRACSTPFSWGDGQLKIGASFGAALSEPGSRSVEDLLQHSDFALYEVKRSGRGNVATYDTLLAQRYNEQSALGRAFVEAVRCNRLSFHFQPVLQLEDGSISGFETLVRWHHPERGNIPPNILIPIAIEHGMMADVDLAAMRAAFDLKAAIREAGFPDVRVGMNASPEALLHPDYLAQLDQLTTERQVDPSQIAIEVLETVILSGSRHAERQNEAVTTLYDRGYRVLLDDFGTGHAGLSQLAQHNFTGIKLDRSLVSKIQQDPISDRIVQTIIQLCSDLELKLIAEGVEDLDTAQSLRAMGCDALQGYWLSPPIPSGDVLNWLHAYTPHPMHTAPAQSNPPESRRAG